MFVDYSQPMLFNRANAMGNWQEAQTSAERDMQLQNLGLSIKKITKPIGHAATSVGNGVKKAAPTIERVA